MSLAAHAGILLLVIVDLAFGGPLVHNWLGRPGLLAFEFALLLGYALFVLGLNPFRRNPPEK